MENVGKIRDQFAAAAVTGLLANGSGPNSPWIGHLPSLAKWAYDIADAMMLERDAAFVKDGWNSAILEAANIAGRSVPTVVSLEEDRLKSKIAADISFAIRGLLR